MTLVLVWFYLIISISFIVGAILVGRARMRLHREQEQNDQLEDLLDSAPDGYFYEAHLKNGAVAYCSRRLCLMLNIVNKKTGFTELISHLTPESAEELSKAFEQLRKKGIPFDIAGSLDNGLMHFILSGRLLYTGSSKNHAYVIWFKDMSRQTALLIEERQAYTRLLQQREVLTQTLNTLPFPLYVQDKNASVCFANKAYDTASEEEADMHWVEMPLNFGQKEENYLLKYGQDKTTEEGLTTLLSDAERAHKMLLKELPFGVVLFNSSAKLTFFNNAFCQIWGIESHFLKKEPQYAELLDKIQERGLLPQVRDFAQYKKVQLNTFAQLTKTSEEYLYLPNGQIVRRLMIPHARGGILILDEKKTTTQPKSTMERTLFSK